MSLLICMMIITWPKKFVKHRFLPAQAFFFALWETVFRHSRQLTNFVTREYNVSNYQTLSEKSKESAT